MTANFVRQIELARFETNPLIGDADLAKLGGNINGPSVIRVPNWILNPLGKYYMYFAHHSGTYIRMAYADDVRGPWKIHEPGTLQLSHATAFRGHVASPDVHVDEANHQIRMYFHGPAVGLRGQWTGVALSSDGIDFAASKEILGKFYFRVWQWQGHSYALAKNMNEGWGELYRSADGVKPFASRGNFLRDVRHSAVLVHGHWLLIFYSRIGDAPERIVMSSVDLRPDWSQWVPSDPIEIIRPSTSYEGIEYPIQASTHGSAVSAHELRDPCVFQDGEELHLFYSIAGEMGIAGAEINRIETAS